MSHTSSNPSCSIVRVDLEAPLLYPSWNHEVVRPDLQLLGPREFDLAWLEVHPTPDSYFKGGAKFVYDQLESERELFMSCLGLAQLQAIKKSDAPFPHHYWEGKDMAYWERKVIAGWRTAIRCTYGMTTFHIPYLDENKKICWASLHDSLAERFPIFRVATE